MKSFNPQLGPMNTLQIKLFLADELGLPNGTSTEKKGLNKLRNHRLSPNNLLKSKGHYNKKRKAIIISHSYHKLVKIIILKIATTAMMQDEFVFAVDLDFLNFQHTQCAFRQCSIATLWLPSEMIFRTPLKDSRSPFWFSHSLCKK